jgi:hypothetical protein
MKFAIATSTFLATAVSVSAAALPSTEGADGIEARFNCNLIAHWDNNWPDLGFRRYSVAARADTGGSQNDRRLMLQKWFDIAKGKSHPSVLCSSPLHTSLAGKK